MRIVNCGPAFFLVLLVVPSLAGAHHSHAEFSKDSISVEGELISVIWSNPHPAMMLKTLDENGREQILKVQVLGNVNGMNRDGVTGDEFHVGQNLRITGQLSTRRQALLLATQVEFDDGTVAVLGPYTSAEGAIYQGQSPQGNYPDELQNSPPSIFHVWSVLERDRTYDPPLRESGKVAKAAWDPIRDDPQLNCSPLGMPSAMMSPHPIEFISNGEDIILRLEEWDGRRTIRLDENSEGSKGAASIMGDSTGHWEGLSFTVKTTNIDFPYLDEYGTPQSPSVEILERFDLSEDGHYLNWSATVTDPATFTEPFVISTTKWQWLPNEAIQPYNCQALEALYDE